MPLTGCIPDGSALYRTLEAAPDPARLEGRVGAALAGLVATWGPYVYSPDGGWHHWVEPFKGPALPGEIRVPVQAPAPLTATVTLLLGERPCLPLELGAWQRSTMYQTLPTWDDGEVAIAASIDGRVDVAWHGRVVASKTLPDTFGWSVAWDTSGALLLAGNMGCGPWRLTGAPDGSGNLFQCLPDVWLATLARGTWSRTERPAIVALLADRSFDAMPIEAQAALVARTDLTGEEKAAIGIPGRKSGSAIATIRGEGVRVAVDGVEAKGWVEGPDGRSVKVPARGLSKVTVQHLDDPDGHWTMDMWLGDGTDVTVSLHWGPAVNGPAGERCGEVVGDAAWQCELGKVTPGAPFHLPCGGPAANGALSFVGVKHGEHAHGGELEGLGFVAGLPGRYRFSEVDGRVTVDRVAETCDGG